MTAVSDYWYPDTTSVGDMSPLNWVPIKDFSWGPPIEFTPYMTEDDVRRVVREVLAEQKRQELEEVTFNIV